MTKRSAGMKKKGEKMLKATLGGVQGVLIPLRSIKMQTFHGTTLDGVVVNSPSVARVGNKIAFEQGDGEIFAIDAADFEIGAKGWLESIGYTVAGSRQKS